MNQQVIGTLLDDLLYQVQIIRMYQVHFLAESDHNNKIEYRQRADAAWKRYNMLHKQLASVIKRYIS
jgi:hypothetical protein